MKFNRSVVISEHAIDRFIEKFEFAGKHSSVHSHVRIAAERAIAEMWHEASYISDDENGIKFRNRDFQIDFIVVGRKICTLFPTRFDHQEKADTQQHFNSRFQQKPKRR